MLKSYHAIRCVISHYRPEEPAKDGQNLNSMFGVKTFILNHKSFSIS